MRSADDLLRLADLNHAESWRERVRGTPAGELVERDDLLLGAPSTRSPAFNLALRTGSGGAPDAAIVIARAREFFGARGRGFLLHTRTHADGDLAEAALAAGCPRVEPDVPVMVLDAAPAPVPGVAVTVIETPAGVPGFVEVNAEAYAAFDLPGDVIRKLFAVPARVLAPHVVVAVVEDGGRAVGAGTLLLSHGIAGIYWIGTRPEARGRGIAAAITSALARIGFARGAGAVILQASELGHPVYHRLGFRTISSYARFFVARPGGA